VNRYELESYVAETYGAVGERLFAKDPSTCVFRHCSNRKWFAVIMELPREKLGLQGDGNICIVNVKCDPRLTGSFRLEQGIFPAYHMSKVHWLTVALDGSVADEKLEFLLEMSFDLTKGRKI